MINLQKIPTDAELVIATLANGVSVEIESVKITDACRIEVSYKGYGTRIYNQEGVNQYKPEFNILKITAYTPEKKRRIPVLWIPRFFTTFSETIPAKTDVMYSGLIDSNNF